MATIAAAIAYDPSTFYYSASTSTGEAFARTSRQCGSRRYCWSFRETLNRALAPTSGAWLWGARVITFIQLVADNIAAVPNRQARYYDANWYNEEREFGCRGCYQRGRKPCRENPARRRWTAALRLAFELTSTAYEPTARDLQDHHDAAPDADLRVARIYHQIFAPRCPSSNGSSSSGSDQRDRRVVDRRDQGLRHRPPGTCAGDSAGTRQFGPERHERNRRRAWRGISQRRRHREVDRRVSIGLLRKPGNATHGCRTSCLMMGAPARAFRRLVDSSTCSTRWSYFTCTGGRQGGSESEQVPAEQSVTIDTRPRPGSSGYRVGSRGGTVPSGGGRFAAKRHRERNSAEDSSWLSSTTVRAEALVSLRLVKSSS